MRWRSRGTRRKSGDIQHQSDSGRRQIAGSAAYLSKVYIFLRCWYFSNLWTWVWSAGDIKAVKSSSEVGGAARESLEEGTEHSLPGCVYVWILNLTKHSIFLNGEIFQRWGSVLRWCWRETVKAGLSPMSPLSAHVPCHVTHVSPVPLSSADIWQRKYILTWIF